MDTHAFRNMMASARSVMYEADEVAKRAIEHGAGRLRRLGVDECSLRELKRELQKFNSITGRWRA